MQKYFLKQNTANKSIDFYGYSIPNNDYIEVPKRVIDKICKEEMKNFTFLIKTDKTEEQIKKKVSKKKVKKKVSKKKVSKKKVSKKKVKKKVSKKKVSKKKVSKKKVSKKKK